MKKRFKKNINWLLPGMMVFMIMGILSNNPAYAQPEKEQVLTLLKGYEWTLEPARFQGLGSDADLTLMEIAADPSLMNAYRFRALEALRLYDNERVADFLENYIDQNDQSSHLRRAFETFSSRFTDTQPYRVQQAARKLLSNPNAQVRISAARALRKLDTASARSSFQRYLGTEKEEWVKQAVQE